MNVDRVLSVKDPRNAYSILGFDTTQHPIAFFFSLSFFLTDTHMYAKMDREKKSRSSWSGSVLVGAETGR